MNKIFRSIKSNQKAYLQQKINFYFESKAFYFSISKEKKNSKSLIYINESVSYKDLKYKEEYSEYLLYKGLSLSQDEIFYILNKLSAMKIKSLSEYSETVIVVKLLIDYIYLYKISPKILSIIIKYFSNSINDILLEANNPNQVFPSKLLMEISFIISSFISYIGIESIKSPSLIFNTLYDNDNPLYKKTWSEYLNKCIDIGIAYVDTINILDLYIIFNYFLDNMISVRNLTLAHNWNILNENYSNEKKIIESTLSYLSFLCEVSKIRQVNDHENEYKDICSSLFLHLWFLMDEKEMSLLNEEKFELNKFFDLKAKSFLLTIIKYTDFRIDGDSHYLSDKDEEIILNLNSHFNNRYMEYKGYIKENYNQNNKKEDGINFENESELNKQI